MAEFAAIYLVAPLLLFAAGTRLGIFLALWSAAFYTVLTLKRLQDFSWRALWEGDGWATADRRRAMARFLALAAILTIVTLVIAPQRLFQFPSERFWLWCVVMVLYPLLSALPQELVYRSLLFRRYGGLIGTGWSALLINGLTFGFCHIVFNNWIAPTFSAVGGIILAHSYGQHRSLKWAALEHSLYGCWVFTVGLGWYFFTGNWRG